MSNVKLAIRVRPFTDKELKSDKDRVQVVSVIDDKRVTITNIKVSASGAGDSRERVRCFNADYTFDSACIPSDLNYGSQEKVFEQVGRQALASISSGQSACILTYGQSATGKTHTMMGTTAQPGLLPRICMALADTRPFNITVSFLEIYNERVHDLLAGEVLPVNSLPRRRGNIQKDLRVREHPTKGPYVQNLRQVTVSDVESLLTVVTDGIRRRRTAATKRNAASSRSHALVEIATPYCKLHLADLAGSEKSGWEGCGGRQKEGSNINKSLVALSNVISALVSGGSGRGRFVPYRDSALTWLLKDCFTGGGSIFIIATVAPGAACYGESASTLRWAARARSLPTPLTRAAPNVPSKAVLQSQFNRLIAELGNHFIKYQPETGKLIYDEQHWALPINKSQIYVPAKEIANIGNIMNRRYSKIEALNSESTPSSIASGSSDIISNMDNNVEISKEINKQIDKLFGPTLERTRSGSDIEVAAPLVHKKRQFRSQEVLSNDKSLCLIQDPDEVKNNELKSKDVAHLSQVPILYDNQRAEIIASVTERLYSKLKKNEHNTSQMDTVTEKKTQNESGNRHNLNELKICSNARQRLMEISKKALRNKRRIGIPAHTQTRRFVVRVKDQEVDIQADLQPYVRQQNASFCTLRQDIGTETDPITPRLKDVSVGPTYSNLRFNDKSTVTNTKQIKYKTLSVMTDIKTTSDRSTQTSKKPKLKYKKRTSQYSKYVSKIKNIKSCKGENYSSPIININISPILQSDSSSDESSKSKINIEKEKHSTSATPDLLTNHNKIVKEIGDIQITESNDGTVNDSCGANNTNTLSPEMLYTKDIELNDFSDDEEITLPRVTVNAKRKLDLKEYTDLILGRNNNIYPYNVKVSPIKQKDDSRRRIRFKNVDVTPDKYNDKWQGKVNKNCTKFGEKEHDSLNDSDYSESSVFSRNDSYVCNNTESSKTFRYNDYPIKYIEDKNAASQWIGFENENYHPCTIRSSTNRETQDYMHIKHQFEFDEKKPHVSYKNGGDNQFENVKEKLEKACNSLELSVNRYTDYLVDFEGRNKYCYKTKTHKRTPTEYLQHLIKLRKEAVNLGN